MAQFAAAESTNDPFDDVMELGDELKIDLQQTTPPTLESPDSTAKADDETDIDADNDLAEDMDSVQALDEYDDLGGSLANETLNDQTDPGDLNQAFEFGALDEDTIDSNDTATLFDPVSQHDDLQQIFGIGPLTEKALNELGITSYSQLAELKEHEIQRIADALQIGPGRIERDNWVGNARRQLEEVLEQL